MSESTNKPVLTWTTPNGVRVFSEVPDFVDEWQDNKYLHIFWSYWQWCKTILRSFGYTGPLVGKRNKPRRDAQRRLNHSAGTFARSVQAEKVEVSR